MYRRITFNPVKSEKLLGVGVGSLLLAEGGHHIHKAPVVLDATLGAASLLFLLLLLVNLGRLSPHFAGTGQRTVDLTSQQPGSHLQGAVLRDAAGCQKAVILQWGAS